MLQPHGAEQAQNTPSRVTFMRFQTPKAMSSLELLGNARKTIQAYTGTWLLQQEGRSPQDCLDYSERRNKTFEREAGLGLTFGVNALVSPIPSGTSIELQAPTDTHPKVYAASARRIKRIWGLAEE